MMNVFATKKQYEQVREFMEVCNQTVNTEYTYPTTKVGLLRIALIEEEVKELKELGFEKDDQKEVLDALCDILYVGLGAMLTFGIPAPNDMNLANETFMRKILPMHVATQSVRRLKDATEQLRRGLDFGQPDAVYDGLDNLLFETYSVAVKCGFDINNAFEEVHASNMSKFCISREEAEQHCFAVGMSSSDKADLYRHVEFEEVTVNGKTLFIIKSLRNGKVLKGPSFFEPDLTKFI